MALIIEDGSIIENANSLVEVQEYRDYLAATGIDTSGDDDTVIEQLLIAALRFVSYFYEKRLQGQRVDATQEWCVPRIGMYVHGFLVDYTTIPEAFKRAQIVSAYKSKTTELLPDIENGRQVKKEKKKLKSLEKETEWEVTDSNKQLTSLTEVELLLRPYFMPKIGKLYY